ncbi:MAG: carboxypeptidase regulatory-like domain-containing protein [Elusimicrobia bacterium]|nr:carboxypeptidase regulatory-like domain-containing protein [Elusimicrobiota bacterium]
MKKFLKSKFVKYFLLSVICYLSSVICCNALEIKSISITDSLGNSRDVFSNTEKVNLNVVVNITAVGDRVSFKFEIYDPAGAKRFTHTGNSIPGTIGEGGSSIKYVPVANFFSTSGKYKLVVYANTVTKEITFSAYSPNITLTYPSNYARDLPDKPLIFRWVASGASKYRIYVDDDAAFFNCIFKDDTTLTQYTYPGEPSDARQKLSAGTIYYWKVEGLDSAGSVVAKTAVPFNFTIKATALPPTSKDLAVIDIDVVGPHVVVSVKNQGGKTENSIPVVLYLNGIPQKKENIISIKPNEIKKIKFVPTIAGKVIAIATVVFDDDYIKNNILTKRLLISAKPEPPGKRKAKIIGSVVSEGGEKLDGAAISYSGPGKVKGKEYTNKGGQYKIEDLPLGEYKLEASCDGYINESRTVDLEKARAYTNINFKLKKKGEEVVTGIASVKGQIKYDTTKEGAEGVDIVLMRNGKEFATFLSSKQGYYRFVDIPADEYLITFSKEGYEVVKKNVDLTKDKEIRMDIGLDPVKEGPPAGEEEEKEKKIFDYTKDTKKCWNIISGVVDKETNDEFKGYKLEKISSDGDVNKIMAAIESGKAKILDIEITSK